MNDVDLKEGDEVTLKSGGPCMTIEGIGIYGYGSTVDTASCVWFDGNERKTALFELHVLKKGC